MIVTSDILTFDAISELRIIAKDAKLDARDQEAVVRASEELEIAQKTAAMLYAQLIETQAQLTAVRDKLGSSGEAKLLFMTMGTGVMKFQSELQKL